MRPSPALARPLLTALLPLLVAGCANGPPWPVSRSPEHITLRWYSDDMTVDQARAAARNYCGRFGKGETLESIGKDGSAQIGQFRCG